MIQQTDRRPMFFRSMRHCIARATALLAALAGIVAGNVAAEPLADLDDAQARAQYAFYTADERSLDSLARAIEQMTVPATLATIRWYDAAYARWSLAQLYAGSARRDESILAAQACQTHVAAALSLDAQLSEALALDVACAMILSEQRGNNNGKGEQACVRSKSLRTALELAPQNPRVLLVEAMCLRRAQPASLAAAFSRSRAVVAAFEAAQPSLPGVPDWGHAEALLLLGENYLQRGEAHAARDVIEQALVIAPDYRQARDLLEKADTRPR